MGLGLDIIKLRSDPNALIIMSHPELRTPIYGYRESEFQLSGSAEYSNPYEQHMVDTNARIGAGVAALDQLIGADYVLPNLNAQINSLHQYISSQRPTIPVQFTIVRVERNQPPVTEIAAQLMAATFPGGRGSTGSDDVGLDNSQRGLLGNPMGYTPGAFKSGNTARDNSTKTWSVQIGQFFDADQLVLRQADPTLSKEVVEDGTSLWCTMNCVFEPIVVPTEADIKRWFRKA